MKIKTLKYVYTLAHGRRVKLIGSFLLSEQEEIIQLQLESKPRYKASHSKTNTFQHV